MDTIDPTAVYRGIRTRITDLVAAVPDDVLEQVCPATPEWRIRDVVAHLSGATADILAGNLDGVASDAWTQAQVDARLHTPLADLLAEWERCAEVVEPIIPDFPRLSRTMFLVDAVTHEHDLRGALGRPGARDSDGIAHAYGIVLRSLGPTRAQVGAGALRIVHDAGEDVAGDGEPTATVRTSRFELARAAVGRRSAAQIAAWDWDGDARPETVVFARFSPPRPTALDE